MTLMLTLLQLKIKIIIRKTLSQKKKYFPLKTPIHLNFN
jgi:hypothetical protein